ncbi:hypothetical protein J6590_012512 [Homalodisca vitripennis]|nr:hypothetical protein J6590_012512 [Homalodisca vitripennis]
MIIGKFRSDSEPIGEREMCRCGVGMQTECAVLWHSGTLALPRIDLAARNVLALATLAPHMLSPANMPLTRWGIRQQK